MCSAIPHADFLRFFDDFGLDALHLIKAKLALVSTEIWVDNIYQRDFGVLFKRIKLFTLKTLDGTPACVQRVGYLCRFGVSWGVGSGIDPTDLKELLALAQHSLPYTKHSLTISDDAALGDPFVHLLLSLFQRKLPKLPENVQLLASSLGLPYVIGMSLSADGFSKMDRAHQKARLVGLTPSSDSGPSLPESRRIQWLMRHPDYMPSQRLDGNTLSLLVTGVKVDIAADWLKVENGTVKFVWEVMRAMYPQFTDAQLELAIKSNTVEGTFALSSFFALALVSENHYSVVASRFKFYFQNFFTDPVSHVNEKGSDVRERFATLIAATLRTENPAFTVDHYYTLAKKASNVLRLSGIDGLFAMCRFLLDKPEVQAAMALGPDRNSEFYTRVDDLIAVHADALKKLVVYDVSTAVFYLQYDPAGHFHVPGVQLAVRDYGPVQVYLAGPPGTGKTTTAVQIFRDLRMDGVRCMPRGSVLLVVVSTNVERTSLGLQLEQAGYTVIDYASTRHLWDPSVSRLDAILGNFSDMSLHYALIVTVHSLCKVLFSKSVCTRAQAAWDKRGVFGARKTDTFDLPHIPDRVEGVWFSEAYSTCSAVLGPLIGNKDMTIDALRRLAYVPVVVVDGPCDPVAITFWFDIAPNLRVHILVPQQRPPTVVVFSELPPWLERLRVALESPSAILLMTDRASAVELFYAALRALAPHRDIVYCTAEISTFDIGELDALLGRLAVIITSPVITVCADCQARNVKVFYASLGGGPSPEMIRQSLFRVRDPDAERFLYLEPPHDKFVSMGKPDPDTMSDLLEQIMRIVNSRAVTRGAFFESVRGAIPANLGALLRDNEATVIAQHLNEHLDGTLPLAILAGIDFNRPVPREDLARVTMNFDPDVAPALSFLCPCTVRQGDRTSDREVCSNCGELPVVVVTGTTSQQPFRLAPLGKPVRDLEGGFFWKPDCEVPRVEGLPLLSPVDVATISDLLRHGNQTGVRRITELLSALLASAAKLSYVEGTADGANLPEAFKTLSNALVNVSSDTMRLAIEALQSKADLVGREHGDLLRQMLGATGGERREFKAAISVYAFMWNLGLPWNNATLDRLIVELHLVAWPDRFKKWQLRKKMDPIRQLQNLSGAGGNLERWLDAAYLMCVGVSAPARGIGSAQQLLERLCTLRLARLFTLFCEISGVDQTDRPLILSTRGLHIPYDRGALILDLAADRADATLVLADVLSGLAAFSMSGRVPDDPALVSVKDAVILAKLTAKFAFGMTLKFKRDGILQWNPAFLVTRLTVLYLRMKRDGPIPGCSPEHHAYMFGVVKEELRCVDDTMTPLLAVAEVPKPSTVIPRTATVNSVTSLGSTQPYAEDGDGQIKPREKDALLSYMRGSIEKHTGLAHFTTFDQCDELWSQLDAEQRALVLGGSDTGESRAHLKLKLHLGKLALDIVNRTKDSVLRRGFEKANMLMRQGTLDSMGSLDPGWARTGNVRESDLSSSESEEEEEETEAQYERKRKRCMFLDDEAGQDDRGENDLDVVSSSVDTQTYD